VITGRETNCISRSSRANPAAIWITRIRIVAANRQATPWSRISEVIATAVAAEIIAGWPPTNELTIAIVTEA